MANRDKTIDSEEVSELCKSFLKLRSEDEIKRFLQDILTNREIQSIASRLKAAHLLNEGTSYIEIGRLTGLSSATIAKVSEELKYGYDGYKIVLERLYKGRK